MKRRVRSESSGNPEQGPGLSPPGLGATPWGRGASAPGLSLLHSTSPSTQEASAPLPLPSSLVCKFKAHKRCAVRATNNCKWTTLASIGKDIREDEDGVRAEPTLGPALCPPLLCPGAPSLGFLWWTGRREWALKAPGPRPLGGCHRSNLGQLILG